LTTTRDVLFNLTAPPITSSLSTRIVFHREGDDWCLKLILRVLILDKQM